MTAAASPPWNAKGRHFNYWALAMLVMVVVILVFGGGGGKGVPAIVVMMVDG